MPNAFTLRKFHNKRKTEPILQKKHSIISPFLSYSSTKSDDTITLEKNKKVGMYIHIPYCRQRCKYCNFSIVPIGKTSIRENTKQLDGFLAMDELYTSSVLQEIELYNSLLDNNTKMLLTSIYIGGGTPSLAPIHSIKQILERIEECFILDDAIEITMEMDPGTFIIDQLISYKSLGINRISLGIQSFNNTILSYIGRTHTYDDVLSSLSIIKQVYEKENISIDLICGLPGISYNEWQDTLKFVVEFIKPNHISIYDLQLEYGTIFGNWYLSQTNEISSININSTKIQYTLPTMEESIQMYKYASNYLKKNNFEHYEISSYAKKSHRSRHNELYWTINGEWFSVGLSSTSSIDNYRFTRPKMLNDYVDWVQNQTLLHGKQMPLDFISLEQEDDYLYDIIMTRLRTSDGLDLYEILNRYGGGVVSCILSSIDELIKEEGGEELVSISKNDKEWVVKLTDPDGFLVSNTILSIIFMGLDEYFLQRDEL